ncbi:MAG: acyl-CoA dehydratase activase [Armatimonadota bacterium]
MAISGSNRTPYRLGIDIGSATIKSVIVSDDEIIRLPIRYTQGRLLQTVREVFDDIQARGYQHVCRGAFTGTGAKNIAKLLGIESVQESTALAAAASMLYPDVRTILEVGHVYSCYFSLRHNPKTERLEIVESMPSSRCAAGTGSFIESMALARLNFTDFDQFIDESLAAESPVSLASRCAVFGETDLIHKRQIGIPRDRLAAGINLAVAYNFATAIVKGRPLEDQVIFIGGVSENRAVIHFLRQLLDLQDRLWVPTYNREMGAIGAALRAERQLDLHAILSQIDKHLSQPFEYSFYPSIALKSDPADARTGAAETPVPKRVALAGLGIDIGSVSTKGAIVTQVDGKFVTLASHYRKTGGDPLIAVQDVVGQLHRQLAEQDITIDRLVAATTGSGRYLTGNFIGADFIYNEIVAQASGVLAFDDEIDTVLEIGGQDSKYISMDGGVIVDFEMNKACAAGTGAFLEKQAEQLGVKLEDFGDLTLTGKRLPILDGTCTVFAEAAVNLYQANNVPAADLLAAVCRASAKNYLDKTVSGRRIGKKVAFQGAVALNKGMVASFETLLNQQILVPDAPHLTGPIGAARLAYLANPETNTFRGFAAIAGMKYKMSSWECTGCSNRCEVNRFNIEDGPTYFYGDRCEKFSGDQKQKRGAGLPDLFAEREEKMLSAYDKPAPAGALRIGIPRGLMTSEYYPLYRAFFGELGYEVVISDPTDRKCIEDSIRVVRGEPCFPFKVAHGHYLNLLEKGVDVIFAPRVISTEQPSDNLNQAQTCPYLQAAPDVIAAAIGLEDRPVRHLAPALHFKGEWHNIDHVLTETAESLGKSRAAAKAALKVARQTLDDFRAWQKQRGKEVLKSLTPDDVAVVVVARPYTLWDPRVNMDIAKKIQDLGIPAIPQDYLPLESVDITDIWKNTYSRQIQKKLAAARLIRQDVRLRAIVVTYFACGPDSFGNHFFKDELGEPCYVMQLDEHTAEAGIITRLEAFLNTATQTKHQRYETIRSTETAMQDLTGRRLWIPFTNHASDVLAAAFRANGIDAAVLPPSPDPGLSLAREQIYEDVCLPMLMTTEDMLHRLRQPDFDPRREAFFQGNSNGPCRFGMYYALQRRIFDRLGYEDVEITTLGIRSEHGGLGLMFAVLTWQALLTHDLLQKMLLRIRPYETEPGTSEALFQHYLHDLLALLPAQAKYLEAHQLGVLTGTDRRQYNLFAELLSQAQVAFAGVPTRREVRPLIGVVGEFYVRLRDQANGDILKQMEALGGETWLAPMTEFFSYANYIGSVLMGNRLKDSGFSWQKWTERFRRGLNNRLAKKAEHELFAATHPFLVGYDDIGSEEVVAKGSRYVNPEFGGEAICSMGKAEDFAERGLAGLVSTIPFNCMPGQVVASLSPTLRQRHDNIPFINLSYNGFEDPRRDEVIADFMAQVKERQRGKAATGSVGVRR